MYTPPFNRVADDAEIRAMVAAAGAGWFVTACDRAAAPEATLLPVLWHGDTVIAHMARANAHWRSVTSGTPVRLVVPGPDAYVSPTWYASKAEHHRVVPTWNYTAVHLTGTLTVHDDTEWVRGAVTALTETHEAGRATPWSVTDAPEQFIDSQLRGVVGIEMTVTGVEGKAKLSQNRSDADRRGVADSMSLEPSSRALQVADLMNDTLGG